MVNSEITIEMARELVGNPVLWPRIRDFLWDFAPQVHESWIEDALAAKDAKNAESEAVNSENENHVPCDLRALCGKVKNSPRVKRFILESLGVKPCFHAFPKDDWSRLVLLDGATILDIVKWLGALACAPTLRTITSGAAVRELKAALPGIYPDVFGYTAYFKSKVESLTVESLKPDMIATAGWMVLRPSLNHLPEELLHRLSLKLPRDIEQPNLSPSTFDFRLSTLQLLMKLRFPEAHSLCFS